MDVVIKGTKEEVQPGKRVQVADGPDGDWMVEGLHKPQEENALWLEGV